jgi:hypothetical protein
MEGHVKALGVIYIVTGISAATVGLFLFAAIAGGGLISGDRAAMLTTGIVGTALAALFAILSLPSIVAGFGLLKFRNWARVLAIIIGVLNLFGFPIGTAIGVYTLYVLLSDQTSPLFESNRLLPTGA